MSPYVVWTARNLIRQVLVGKIFGVLMQVVAHLEPCGVTCLHAHGCARRPEHTPWVLKPGEFSKLLLSTNKARALVTCHLIYLEQACHQNCSLLRERRWAREVSIPPHACLVRVLVLKPVDDSITRGDPKAKTRQDPGSAAVTVFGESDRAVVACARMRARDLCPSSCLRISGRVLVPILLQVYG